MRVGPDRRLLSRGLPSSLVAVLASIFALTACGGAAQSASSSNSTFQLRFGGSAPAGNPADIASQYFISKVTELTHGRVTISYFPADQLGTELNMLNSVELGELDFADLPVVALGDAVPSLQVYNLPFLINTPDELKKVFNSSFGKKALQGASQKGAQGLAYFSNGELDVIATKAAMVPDDFKGMKLRIPNDPISQTVFKKFGAIPVVLGAPQVYPAFQQGVINGAITTPAFSVGGKLYEVAKYLDLVRYTFAVQPTFVSTKTLARLPADLRQDILKAGALAQTYAESGAGVPDYYGTLKGNGVTTVDVNGPMFTSVALPLYSQISTVSAADIASVQKIIQ